MPSDRDGFADEIVMLQAHKQTYDDHWRVQATQHNNVLGTVRSHADGRWAILNQATYKRIAAVALKRFLGETSDQRTDFFLGRDVLVHDETAIFSR